MLSLALPSVGAVRKRRCPSRLLLLVAVISLGVSVAGLEHLPMPFVWIGACVLVVVGAAAWLTPKPVVRALWVNVGAIVASFCLFEAFLWLGDGHAPVERFEGTYTTDYFVDHPLLGYAPSKDSRATVAKYVGERLVYEVAYTIDRNGLRITPSPMDAGADRSILFFGGSVTFGEGVADEQAMPYLVGMRSANRYAVHNFGFHGYGPHQMLVALEQGLTAAIVERPPRYVIYQAIPAHVGRAVGLASWDVHGPRYEVRADGGVRFAGHFDDSRGWLRDSLVEMLGHSRAYSKLLGQGRAVHANDIRRYLGIVRTARDLVVKECDDCEFHVILWGYPGDVVFDRILAGLDMAGIATHTITDILPAYAHEPQAFELSADDKHPNPAAHALIADYVASRIVDRTHGP